MAAVLWLALKRVPIGFINDKLDHVAAFAVRAAFCGYVYPKLHLDWTGLSLITSGAAIEGVQATSFVHRDAELWTGWLAGEVGGTRPCDRDHRAKNPTRIVDGEG